MFSGIFRTYIMIGIIIFALIIIGVYAYYRQSVVLPKAEETAQNASPVVTPQKETPKGPSFSVERKGKGQIVVRWQNLPADTSKIYIFRALLNTDKWTRWQILNLNPNELASGEAVLNLGSKENSADYKYYVQTHGTGSEDPT